MQYIYLDGTETSEELRSRGMSRASAWRALKRGWYTVDYHRPDIADPWEPAGQFSQIYNPWAFAYSQVVRILHQYGDYDKFAHLIEDWVQDGLEKVWASRHKEANDFVALAATIICRKTKDNISKERLRITSP